MKFRLLALILALSLVGLAQDNPAPPPAPNSTPAHSAQACCHHNMAEMDAKECCHHDASGAKDAAGCCKGKDKCEMKDGKSCCEGKDAKAAMKECKKSGCCKSAKSCGGAKGDKSAANCCGNKCERHAHEAAIS
jgi:uncharacterized protein involved in copper resistance